jgi:hypothetical protein
MCSFFIFQCHFSANQFVRTFEYNVSCVLKKNAIPDNLLCNKEKRIRYVPHSSYQCISGQQLSHKKKTTTVGSLTWAPDLQIPVQCPL